MYRKILGFALCFVIALVTSAPAEAQTSNKRWERRTLKGLEFRTPGVELYHNETERVQFQQEMTDVILNYIIFCQRRGDKKIMMIRSCRIAHGGCEERIKLFVGYILDASDAYNINPWLLAAMAFNESRFNPFAEGPTVSSRGILQINPRTKRGRASAFVRNGRRAERFRKKCKTIPGNCQREIVFFAADHIDSAVRRCGSVAAGLSMYNTGRCDVRRKYVTNTARVWRDLQLNNGEKQIVMCDRVGKKKKRRRRSNK